MKKLLILFVSILSVSLLNAGESDFKSKKIPAYLEGSYIDVATAKTKLQGAGFEVLATYEPVKQGTTIVFTNSALKKEAKEEKRAHAAILKMFVDEKDKAVSITNPIYFGKAFMQGDYNHDVWENQYNTINKAFAGLKGSKEAIKFKDLDGYHFMFGMPYYEDFEEVGEGDHSGLISKAKKGKIVFELTLSKDSTLVGYELSEKTREFVEKVGRKNAAVLPYTIAIEEDEAKIMAAKYYLAISYPKLTMGEFMKISDIPGKIKDELEIPFK